MAKKYMRTIATWSKSPLRSPGIAWNHMLGCSARWQRSSGGWTQDEEDMYHTLQQPVNGRHWMIGDQISQHFGLDGKRLPVRTPGTGRYESTSMGRSTMSIVGKTTYFGLLVFLVSYKHSSSGCRATGADGRPLLHDLPRCGGSGQRGHSGTTHSGHGTLVSEASAGKLPGWYSWHSCRR